jgi:membrane protein implicated in regulation of membrane protease activity
LRFSPTFRRYLLFQIPGWVIAAVVLNLLLPRWTAVLLLTLYMLKDFVLYPWLRMAYDTETPIGGAQLVGQTAVTRDNLNPKGYVFVRGELWRAEARPAPVPANTLVRILHANGLTLLVEPLSSGPPHPSESVPDAPR